MKYECSIVKYKDNAILRMSSANQWTEFYMIETSVMKELNTCLPSGSIFSVYLNPDYNGKSLIFKYKEFVKFVK